MESTQCSQGGIIVFVVGLIAGTFSALLCKIAYETPSVGLDGTEKLFAKPIMMLLLMFGAMIPAIVFWLIQQATLETKDRDSVSLKTMGILIVPCICDLLCTLLLLIAQLYITASMWQMLRGTVICITALLKCFLLNHRLRKHMWVGVGVICCAMILVASTSFLNPPPTSPNAKDPRIGVALVMVGCLAQGVQYVFEEKVMAVDNAPPLVVIGCEGIWGTLLTVLLVYPTAYYLPGDDNGSFENPFDALTMINNNQNLKFLLIGFVVTVTIYNCMAVYVTKLLSAIWHAILDNFRPVTIWAVDLWIFYVLLPGTGLGESWTSASYLQLAGLLVLFLGTAIYNGDLPICCAEDYHELELLPLGASHLELAIAAEARVPPSKTPHNMSSPALARSPLIHQNQRAKHLALEKDTSYSSTGTAGQGIAAAGSKKAGQRGGYDEL